MGAQQSLFGDPTAVAPTLHRHDHPATSRIASERSAPRAASQRGYLLKLIHDAGTEGLTAYEAEDLMRPKFPGMRHPSPRIVDLRDQGWILTDYTRTRETNSGSPSNVHIFNPEAEAAYREWVAR